MNQNNKINFSKKYRPLKFSDLISQEEIKKILQNILKNQINVSSFLFYGERGCGKTSSARIFAAALNCENLNSSFENSKNTIIEPCGICQSCSLIQSGTNLDILEVDAASNNSVDNIRLIIENSKYLPQISRKKIYILDEVHMLSLSAFNALLKVLEEPPEYTIFILITTEYRKIPLTVISRCLRLHFKKLENSQISEFLEKICTLEKIEYEKKALNIIASLAEGAIRDSLSLLQSASILSSSNIQFKLLPEIFGICNEKNDLFQILIDIFSNQIQNSFDKIEKLLRDGMDAEIFIQDLISLISEITLLKKTRFNDEIKHFDEFHDFSSFNILSNIDKNQIYLFFENYDILLSNFDNLYEILKILNQSFEILNQNIYQDPANFLKIMIIKISLSFSFENQTKKNNIKNQIIQNVTIHSNSEDINKNINTDQDLAYSKNLVHSENITHSKNLNDSENQPNLKKQIDSENINHTENLENPIIIDESSDQFLTNLSMVLKENHEFFISDLILTKKILLDIENKSIIDNNAVPSKHLQFLLKILRGSFDQKWKIILKENIDINQNQSSFFKKEKSIEINQNSKKRTIFNNKENINNKALIEIEKSDSSKQAKFAKESDDSSVIESSSSMEKEKSISQKFLIENFKNKSHSSSDEIKKKFIESEFFQKIKEIFKVSSDNVKIIK